MYAILLRSIWTDNGNRWRCYTDEISEEKFKETIAIIRGQPTGIFVTKLEMINYMGVEIEVANRCTYTIT